MEMDYKEIILSSEYTEEDEAMSFVEDGLKYSCDGLRLLKATEDCPDKIMVRKGVLVICDDAFSQCQASKVVLPESLVLIGVNAFACCSLEEVTIPNNVLEIGAIAFYGCTKLKRVFFENLKLAKVGEKAFMWCHNIEPNCKTEIEEQFGSRVFKEENSHSSSSGNSGCDHDSRGSWTDSSDYEFGLLKDNEPWFYVP